MKIAILIFIIFYTSITFADYKKGVMLSNEGNKQEAFKEFKKSAKTGDPSSQFAIATHYYYGDHVNQNYKLARKYFTESANQDFIESLFFLGQIYELGKGVNINNKKAFDFYKKAAESCLPQAQTALAFYYYKGIEININKIEAASWLMVAYWLGDKNANNGLQVIMDEMDEKSRSKAISRQKNLIKQHGCYKNKT